MNDRSDPDDGALAALSLAGDQRAFAEIVRRHKQLLYRIIVRLVGQEDDALDLVQESFVAAHGALRRYDPDRPMRAWLSRIAINKARDWRRRERVRAAFRFALPLQEAPEIVDERVSVEAETAHKRELADVQRRIARLPRALREVLVLRTIDDLSQGEVADILGISGKAVETRLYRARRRLAEPPRGFPGRRA